MSTATADSSESPAGRRAPEKIILLGDRGVGKTSLLRYLINGTFSRTSTQTVDGKDEVMLEYRKGTRAISICVTDTAGRNSEYTLSDSYYRDAAAAVLVYSLDSDITFRRLVVEGYQSVKSRTPEALIFIVGNKEDLYAEVSSESVSAFASSEDIPSGHLFSVSCLTGRGVKEAFDSMADILIIRAMEKRDDCQERITLSCEERPMKLKKSCC